MAKRQRKGISTRTRFEIFKRDSFACQYCGRTPPAVTLHVDHIVPVAMDGGDEETNLITSCRDCNAGKAAVPLGDKAIAPKTDLAERQERLKQLKAYNAFLMNERREQDEAITRLGIYWHDAFMDEKGHWVFGRSRLPSIRKFLEHLPEVEIMEAMDIAHAKFESRHNKENYNVFKYFCGVCWRKIKGDTDG